MENRSGDKRIWKVKQSELPLYPDDPKSPWILAPPEVIKVMRKMQKVGERLGDYLTVRQLVWE